MGNFKSEERSTIGANVSVRFLGDEYSTNKVFVETADTNTTSSSPCPCAPASLRLGLAYLVNKKELNNTCWSPMLSDWIEACSPPVSEARGHVRSPNCIKVRTLDCLHEVKQGSADMLKCRFAHALTSMKEALQEQQSYGLKLKGMLDAGRFSAERRAGQYAEELKMIKQQHFLSTYPFQLEEQLENACAHYVMSTWHAATAESRNKLDLYKLNRNVSMKCSCVSIWSRAALHAARRTHASKKMRDLCNSDAPEEQEPKCCRCNECDYAEEESRESRAGTPGPPHISSSFSLSSFSWYSCRDAYESGGG
jgi:hypothetical protein